MNVHRINLMIKMLEEVKAGTWKSMRLTQKDFCNMDTSYNHSSDQKFDLKHWVQQTDKTDCGYSACAIGHATLDPRFRKLGLKFYDYGVPNYTAKDGEDYDSFEAVALFFGIQIESHGKYEFDDSVAIALFSPSSYPLHLQGNDLIEQIIRRLKLLLNLGCIKFKDTFCYVNNKQPRLISPQLRVYKPKEKQNDFIW